MYYEYFGLKHPPFRITPDTSLFYPGGKRGAILEALRYAIMSGEGIVKVVGEVGSGKTMLCRMLQLELPPEVEVVYLANPSVSPENILHAIAFELRLPVAETASRLQVMRALQDHLLQKHAQGHQVVVFIEEAQSMPLATLEEIRLLSNLETSQHKLLQIILFGQPELDTMLLRPRLRQLRERITYSFKLEPLRSREVREYLNARVQSCGQRSSELFTTGAVRLLARHSRGLLRRINILADKALLAAYADGARKAGRRQVKAAVRDTEFDIRSREPAGWLPLVAGLLLAGFLGIVAIRFAPDWMRSAGEAAGPAAASGQSTPDAVTAPSPADTPEPLSQHGQEPAQAGENTVDGAGAALEIRPQVAAAAMPSQEATADIQMSLAEAAGPASGNFARELGHLIIRLAAATAPGGEPAVMADETMTLAGDMGPVSPPARQEAAATQKPFSLAAQQIAGAVPQREAVLMEQLLRDLPPEEITPVSEHIPAETCRVCTAIIYRPLRGLENLN